MVRRRALPFRFASRALFASAAVCSLQAGACQMQRPVARGMPRGGSTACIFGVRGVRTFLEDTPDGMDTVFTVVGDGSELRRRAHAALTGAFPVSAETQAIEQRVHATIRDESDGLTIHVVPIKPEDLDSVRAAIRHRIEEAATDECP